MNDLIARLIADGTSPALVAEVAMELGRAQGERDALSRRRQADADRQQARRDALKGESHVTSRDVTDVTDVTEQPLSLPPNENNLTPPPIPENNTPARKGPVFVCPNGVQPDVWADFLKARKTKGATNSATAYAKVLRDIETVCQLTGEPPGEVVRVAAERGWASINDWTDGKPKHGTNRGSPTKTDRRDGFERAIDDWIGHDPFAASQPARRMDGSADGDGRGDGEGSIA